MAQPQKPQTPQTPQTPQPDSTGNIQQDVSESTDLRVKPGTAVDLQLVLQPDGTYGLPGGTPPARPKPVSSQTIEPIKPEIQAQPTPGEQALPVQRAGERMDQGVVQGREYDVSGAKSLTPEGRQAVAQGSSAVEAMGQRDAAREEQAMPTTGPVPNVQSTSEQVRGLGSTQEPSFGREMVGAHRRNVEDVMSLARKAGLPVDRPEIRAVVEAAVSLPSDQVGAAVEALLLRGNTTGTGSREKAQMIGAISSFLGSMGYEGVREFATSSAKMGGKLAKLPTALERTASAIIPDEKLLRLGQVGEEAIKTGGGFTLDGAGRAVKVAEDQAVVSVLPGRSRIIEGQATAEQIRDFAVSNADVLRAHPELRIGGWEDGGKTYLDISMVTDPERAALLGRANNQKSIFLGTGQVMELGGTGVGGGVIDESVQLAGLRKTVESSPHSGVADTLAAEAAANLADTPTGIELHHGTGTAFDQIEAQRGGIWLAEKKSGIANDYAAPGAPSRMADETGSEAFNVRPYYLDPNAQVISREDARALVGTGSQEEIANALREKGYDAMVMDSPRGKQYFVLNPDVLIEKFTGNRAGMVAMVGAGAATGAYAGGDEQGGVSGAMAGALIKGKGKNVLRAAELAKSTSGNLRYLTKATDWANVAANSKAVGGASAYAASIMARSPVPMGREELAAQMVAEFGHGIQKHLPTILERADEKYAEVLSRLDMTPVERVVEFFRTGQDLPEWYASAERMRQAFGLDAPLISNLIAATSAKNANSKSVQAALDIFHAFKTGKFDANDPESVAKWFRKEMKRKGEAADLGNTSMTTHLPNVQRALLGQELSGNKVSNYARAIMGDESAVVIDTHMVEAFAPSVDFKAMLREVPTQYHEQIRKAVEGNQQKWADLVFQDDAVYSYFEGLVRQFADEHGVTPRFAQEAIWEGRVAADGKVKESNLPIVEMFEQYATEKGYQQDFPGLSFKGTAALSIVGAAAMLADISTQSEGEGGTTPGAILAIAPGVAGNKKMMKFLVETVRELRRIPPKVVTIFPTQAVDMLTRPRNTIKAGDKLLAMDWVGMSQDLDHLPGTIKKVREEFDAAIKADSRGVVSHELERQMAETLVELGYDAEAVLAKWKSGDRAVISTEVMAVAELTKAAYREAEDLGAKALKLDGKPGFQQALDEYGRQFEVFGSLVLVLDGQAEEAGRVLGIFKAVVGDVPQGRKNLAVEQARLAQKGMVPQRPGNIKVAEGAPKGGTFEPADPVALKSGMRKLVDDAVRSFSPEGSAGAKGTDPAKQELLAQVDALVEQWNTQVKTQPDAATQALKEQVGALVRQWNESAAIEKPSTKQRSFMPTEGERQVRPPDEAINELLDQVGRMAEDFNLKAGPAPVDPLTAKLQAELGKTVGQFNEAGATAFGGKAGNPKGFQGPPTPSAVAGAVMAQQAKAQAAYGQYLQGVLQAWSALPKSSQRSMFVRGLAKWGADAIKEIFYSSYLLTFPGQIANLGGSMAMMAGETMSKAIGVGIGKLRHNILGLGAAGSTMDEISEGTLVGMHGSILEAVAAAGTSFVTGTSKAGQIMGGGTDKVPRAFTGQRIEELAALTGAQVPNAVYHGMNILGMTIGAGPRAMLAGDDFNKVVAFRGELWRLAVEAAHRSGQAGDEVTKGKFIADFVTNPDEWAVKAAREYAHYVTATNPLTGPVAKGFSRVGKSIPMLPFTPFFDTLVNLTKYSLEWAPGLNFLVKKSREAIFAGGPRADQAMAKLGVGSVLMYAAAVMYQNGNLQGPGPSNPAMRKMLEETVKYVPNSIAWHSPDGKTKHQFGINRFDPIAFPFLFMAAWGDIALEAMNGREISWSTAHEVALAGTLALGEVASTRGYFQGFKQMLDIALAKDVEGLNRAHRIIENVIGQVVPSAGPQLGRSVDPYFREVYTYMDKIYSRLPWMSDSLTPEINLKGEPRHKTPALGPDWVSPIPYNKSEISAVGASWFNNDVAPEKPSRSAFGPPPPPLLGEETAVHGFMRSPKQQERYERLAGNELKLPPSVVSGMLSALGYKGDLPDVKMGMWDMQEALLKTRMFQEMTPLMQGKLQRGLIQTFRKMADGQLVKEDKSYRDKYIAKTLDRVELAYGAGARAQAEAAIKDANLDDLVRSIGEQQ